MTTGAKEKNMSGQPALEMTKLTDEDLVDVNRSRLYRLLALGFGFPCKELHEAQAELREIAAALYPDLELTQENVNLLAPEIESLYINVIDGHNQKKACRPYETAWREGDRSMQQWEVKKLYQIFGLELNKDTNELPDHLVNELEFMHFLSHQAVEAGRGMLGGGDARKQYVHAQKDFLERHLSLWVPKFCKALQEKVDEPFYVNLAALTAQFVMDDLEWVQEQYEAENG
ncbi:MAG: molecular chaperone TorD family protein [Pseudomonadota bacterium]